MKNIVYWVNTPALYANTSVIWWWAWWNVWIIPTFNMVYNEDEIIIDLDYTPKALIIHASYWNWWRKQLDCRSFVTNDSSSWLYYDEPELKYEKVPTGYDIFIYRDSWRQVWKRVNIINNWIKIENLFNTVLDVQISIQVFW